MLRRAVEHLHGQEYTIQAGSAMARKLGEYAELLAAEGTLQTALGYLTGVTQVRPADSTIILVYQYLYMYYLE